MFNIVYNAGTQQVNYLYGGRVTTDYAVHGTYGISGGISSGYYSHGAANYSSTQRTMEHLVILADKLVPQIL